MNILASNDRRKDIVQNWIDWLPADHMWVTEFLSRDLSKYDLIMVYLTDEKWIDLVGKTKKKYPHIKMVLQIDSDWGEVAPPNYTEINGETLNILRSMDLIIDSSWFTHNYLKSKGCMSGHFISLTPEFAEFKIAPMSYWERKKLNLGASVIHAQTPCEQIKVKEFIRELKLKPMYIGSDWAKGDQTIGLNSDEYFPSYGNTEDYIKKLNTGLVGFVDDYSGVSRFTHECAILKIPVIGTRTAFLLKEYVSDDMLCNYNSISTMKNIADEIIHDESLYNEIRENTYIKAINYFKPEVARKRLITNLNSYMNINIK